MTIVSPTYFGPVQWYAHLLGGATVELHDHYQKQTYRNRCEIATVSGRQTLTVPVARDSEGRAHVSEHGSWRRVHWQALLSAYGESPFFDYYADDLRPLFETHFDLLYDLDLATTRTILRLLDLSDAVPTTDKYVPATTAGLTDLRDAIHPKHPQADEAFTPRPYYQVYAEPESFTAGLSILDLLFNMGPEAPLWLTLNK